MLLNYGFNYRYRYNIVTCCLNMALITGLKSTQASAELSVYELILSIHKLSLKVDFFKDPISVLECIHCCIHRVKQHRIAFLAKKNI